MDGYASLQADTTRMPRGKVINKFFAYCTSLLIFVFHHITGYSQVFRF